MAVMIIFDDTMAKRGGFGLENAEKTELQRKWMVYRRFFNTRPTRVNFAQAIAGPVMQLMLNHFYDAEIKGPYKFDEIELTDSVVKNFFNDIAFNHLP